MRFSHLVGLAFASAVTAQVVIPPVTLNAAVATNLCLGLALNSAVAGTPVRLEFCTSTILQQWVLNPFADTPAIGSAANSSLCLDGVSPLGTLQVSVCDINSTTQRFSYDSDSNQIQIMTVNPVQPIRCVSVGSAIDSCNATDPGVLWAPQSTIGQD